MGGWREPTYILGFDSNNATAAGLRVNTQENGYATIVEEDNTHIKLFDLGSLDEDKGGIAIQDGEKREGKMYRENIQNNNLHANSRMLQ